MKIGKLNFRGFCGEETSQHFAESGEFLTAKDILNRTKS